MPKSLRSPRQTQLQTLLVEMRRATGMTQADVAAKLGKPQSFVAKYERGERRLDVIEFLDVADALGSDPCELLKRLRSPSEESRHRAAG